MEAISTERSIGPAAVASASRQAIFVVIGLWLLGVLRLLYTNGTGEHDVFMMAAGVVRGQTGGVLNELCYGTPIQFLFYYAFRVITLIRPMTSAEVLLLVNIAGAISSLAMALLMLRVFSTLLAQPSRAELAILLLVSSPMYYYLIWYGHPFHIGVVVLLCAWMALLKGFDSLPSRRGWLLIAASTVLQSLSFMIRLEQVAMTCALLMGLLALRRRYGWFHVTIAATASVVAMGLFVGCAVLFARTGGLQGADPSTTGGLALLRTSADLQAVIWGTAHIVVEVGLPLLALAGLALTVGALRSDWATMFLVGTTGVLPTLAIYIGNPSPTRHLYLLAVGLGCFVASVLNDTWVGRLRRYAVPILAFNLVLPWGLAAVDGGPRSTVTYNVVERTDRNRTQIADAQPFYDRLLIEAHKSPVVVFGGWVHVAQLAALAANDPDMRFEPAKLPGGVFGFAVRKGSMELYLVETYDRDFIVKGIAAIHKADSRFRCVSVVSPEDGNDVLLEIPKSMTWWS